MIRWIRNEITCIRMLFRLARLTEDYNVVLLQLHKMRELVSTLGELGLDIQSDIEKAEDQCTECIQRFNAVDASLKDRNYRYINNQMIFVVRQTKIFDELVQKIRTDALVLGHLLNQGAQIGDNELK